MKKYFLLLIFITSINLSFGQLEAANWYFGNEAGLNFTSGTPIALNNSAMSQLEGCATISDANGNLLFYTNGQEIYNSNHQLMQNGTGLLGSQSSSQSAIIIPAPLDSNRYYIFTVDSNSQPNGLNYSVVDMTLDGGFGGVDTIEKNIQLDTPVAEKLTATYHANGQDIWVIAHRMATNEFVSYLVSSTGVNTIPEVSSVGQIHAVFLMQGTGLPSDPDVGGIGYMKISPNGKKIAVAIGYGNTGLELFDFDNATGILSNPLLINSYSTYGVEFSPNSKVLYSTSNVFNGIILQYDLTQTTLLTIQNSQSIINGVQKHGALQLGIDGKIYAAQNNFNTLSVINNPNVLGVGCNYVSNAISLNGKLSSYGLPPFISNYFQYEMLFDNLCEGQSVEFEIETRADLAITNWDFGDPSSGVNNTSALESPSHIFNAPGTYTVSVDIENIFGHTITLTENVEVQPKPIANPLNNIEICDTFPNDNEAVFDMAVQTTLVLGPQDPNDYEVTYHLNQVDADSGDNELTGLSSYTNTSNPQTVHVRVTNPLTGCYAVTDFDLVVNDAPEISTPGDLQVCDETSNDGISEFDLTNQDADILGLQNPADYTVTYYLDFVNADAGTNELTSPYSNIINPQPIFVRVENNVTGCYSVSPDALFNLIVIPRDLATFTVSPTCDGGTVSVTGTMGGTFAFNPVPIDGALIDAITGDVTGGTPGATYTIEYTTNGNCANSSAQALNVHPLPTVVNPSPLVVCDDTVFDGMTEMDLTVKNDEITANNPGYIVTYHINLIDAQNGSPEVSPAETAYVGTDGETLFVRVEDAITGCYTTTTMLLNVTNGPSVATPAPLRECDVDNDNLATFDISGTRDDILAADPTLDVSFHLTEQNALDDVNPLGDIISNVIGQIIYVRVDYGYNNDCPTVLELQLIVEPKPETSTSIAPYAICDDDFDGTASFDLTTMNATIYGSQDPNDYVLTYHETLADAESSPGLNPIIEPDLSNYVSGDITIYSRLEGINGCIAVGQFDLIVNPLPIIPFEAQDTIYEICDNSMDNDGYAIFDLTSQNEAFTGGDANLVVNYFETMLDIPNNPISNYTSYENVSIGGLPHNPQTIFVTVTETTSGGNCYSITSLTLLVNTLPTPNDILPDIILCDDNNPGDLREEFDLTQNETLMINDFDETVTYHESLADAESGENAISNETAYTNNSTVQTIYVRVTNTGDPSDSTDDGTGCYSIVTFEIIVNPVPMFMPDELYIICLSTNGTEVVREPTIDTGLSTTDYTFEWQDPNGILVSLDSSYTASQTGIYTVTITDINTMCSNVIPFDVEESSPPIIDAVVVTEAFADNNVIEVTATGNGIAQYEFSIDNGPWVSNDPSTNTYTFTNVSSGEHLISVRDIYGCGTTTEPLFVIDYPLYFTPNGDGINETWNITGIGSSAKIYIFDRYGKLLKQISPDGIGWNGTYNGNLMPSNDYWFTVEYYEPGTTERKEFRAHFTLKR